MPVNVDKQRTSLILTNEENEVSVEKEFQEISCESANESLVHLPLQETQSPSFLCVDESRIEDKSLSTEVEDLFNSVSSYSQDIPIPNENLFRVVQWRDDSNQTLTGVELICPINQRTFTRFNQSIVNNAPIVQDPFNPLVTLSTEDVIVNIYDIECASDDQLTAGLPYDVRSLKSPEEFAKQHTEELKEKYPNFVRSSLTKVALASGSAESVMGLEVYTYSVTFFYDAAHTTLTQIVHDPATGYTYVDFGVYPGQEQTTLNNIADQIIKELP